MVNHGTVNIVKKDKNMSYSEKDSEHKLAIALEKRTLLNFYSNQCFDILTQTVEKVDSDKLKKAIRNLNILEQVIKDYKRNNKELSVIEKSLREEEDFTDDR